LFVGRDNLAQADNLSALEKLVQNKPSDEYFKGTNEYIDPSKNPKYTKNYNEIFFGSEGISVDELAELSQVVDLTQNPTETPQAVM
jgi:hypothetical protein